MTMEKHMCTSCPTRHFDYYICGNCGEGFSCVWPSKYHSGDSKPYKFCPYCGASLGRVKDPDKLKEYKEK